MPTVILGGFNSDFHPIAIETAIANSKSSYSETGFLPNIGSTQLWRLGEELLVLIKRDLYLIRHKFPDPKVID